MKKIVTLFIASAAAFSAFAAPPEAKGAERKKEACEWQGAPSIDSIMRQWQSALPIDSVAKQRQEQVLAQMQERAGADLLRQSVAPGDSAGKQQRHKQRQEQMQARKVGYFTTQLELTPEEAALFWPVYNEYWKKRDDLFNERNSLIRKAKRDKVDDKKALQIAQRMVGNLQDDANLTREYNEKFTKILSPQKLLKYYIAEESFKVELLNVLRKHGSKVEN
ncbi:MAG: hypothetical protein LBJ57_02250 [Prevotellaceae bacterium]|jgi:flagellar motor protein MotB|nr:hypothetical protein [Prevotellaceae bacterium]